MPSLLPLFGVAAAVAVAPAIASTPVTLAAFSAVQLNGGGEVLVRPGPAQRVTFLEGTPTITEVEVDRERNLKIRACASRCPGNYRLKVLVETPWLPAVAVNGGGTIRLDGPYAAQRTMAAAVHGGGTIDLRAASVSDVSAAITGGGRILAGPARSLAVAITGGGHVSYAGDPRITSTIRGGGSVNRR